MKKYIVTFQIKGKSFNESSTEEMWFEGKNRSEIEVRASLIARTNNSKIVSIRWVK